MHVLAHAGATAGTHLARRTIHTEELAHIKSSDLLGIIIHVPKSVLPDVSKEGEHNIILLGTEVVDDEYEEHQPQPWPHGEGLARQLSSVTEASSSVTEAPSSASSSDVPAESVEAAACPQELDPAAVMTKAAVGQAQDEHAAAVDAFPGAAAVMLQPVAHEEPAGIPAPAQASQVSLTIMEEQDKQDDQDEQDEQDETSSTCSQSLSGEDAV